MLPENVPIIIDRPDLDAVEIYPVHDLHYGSAYFDAHKWNEFTRHILAAPNRFLVFVGDLMENSLPNNKNSDVFEQTATPRQQQDFLESVFLQFADRTLAIVDGNHEHRAYRTSGLFPLFSAACIARIDDRYRSAYSVLDFGFGNINDRASRAVGFIAHRAKELKNFGSVDSLEGFDFMFCGHDHEPDDHPRGHLVYDRQRREVKFRSVEKLNSGSFLIYGGYGVRAGYRPKSDKMYKLVLRAERDRQKTVETVGFYL